VLILALPPQVAHKLVPTLSVPTASSSAITIHYAWNADAMPTIATAPSGFDLIRTTATQISLSIRPAAHAWSHDPDFLAEYGWHQLRRMHPTLPETLPDYAIRREKLASHLPDFTAIPAQLAEDSRIILAGDWLDPSLPASIERAVATGAAAPRTPPTSASARSRSGASTASGMTTRPCIATSWPSSRKIHTRSGRS
jgi:hypothetical protein